MIGRTDNQAKALKPTNQPNNIIFFSTDNCTAQYNNLFDYKTGIEEKI